MLSSKRDPTPGVLSTVRRPAEQKRQLPRQRQAETGAPHSPLERAVHLGELLEDPRLVLRARCRCRCRPPRRPGSRRPPAGRDPDLAPLGELDGVGDEVAQDLGELALVGVQRRPRASGVRTPGATVVAREQRPQHAPQRAEDVAHRERREPNLGLPRFDLARGPAGRPPDRSASSAAFWISVDLQLLLRVELAVHAGEQDAGHVEDRVERRAELVGDAGEEGGLELRGPPQLGGPVVQLGVERQHAAVGLRQLGVEPVSSAWRSASVVERAHQLLVLVLELRRIASSGGRPRSARPSSATARRRRARRGRAGSSLPRMTDGALPGPGSMSKRSVEPAGADQPDPQPGRRLIPARRAPASRCGMPGPRSSTRTTKSRRGAVLQLELHPAAAGVLDGVPRDLGDRRRETRLILPVEARAGRRSGGCAGAPAPRPRPGEAGSEQRRVHAASSPIAGRPRRSTSSRRRA